MRPDSAVHLRSAEKKQSQLVATTLLQGFTTSNHGTSLVTHSIGETGTMNPVLETPTLSILDRHAAYWYDNDAQCWDQAVMVARNQAVDWDAIYK